jgi:hypothetical protein
LVTALVNSREVNNFYNKRVVSCHPLFAQNNFKINILGMDSNNFTPEKLFLTLFKKVPHSVMGSLFKKRGVEDYKVNKFQAFTKDLIEQIYDTFLGNECINNINDIKNHFDWCYSEVSEKHISNNYKYKENKELYDYFLEYFQMNIYAVEESRESDYKFFSFLLDYPSIEIKMDVDAFLDLYGIFDNTPVKGRVLVESNYVKGRILR